jgi:hypothetical protein
MPADDGRFPVRPFRSGDESAILDLFARAFPHARRSVESWRWKYERNPFGARRISLALDPEGRVVGQDAAYPVPLRYGERELVANQIGDTMTDVAVRHVGRGPTSILGRTAAHFYQHFAEGQVAFNYGFNVANIQKFSVRFLRADVAEQVPYRVRDLRAHPLPPIGRRERWPRGWQLELVRRTSTEWDRFFERVAPQYVFLVRRDARWVQWRYLDCPDADYAVVAVRKWRRLVAWIVFRIRENRFTLGDLLLDPRHPEALEVALRHVVPSYPVDLIEGWLPPRPPWLDALLRDLHFEPRPEPQGLGLMCVPFAMPAATARMRESLYYTWGDSDLF